MCEVEGCNRKAMFCWNHALERAGEQARKEGARNELQELKRINEDYLKLELGFGESSIEAITIFRKAWIKYRSEELK